MRVSITVTVGGQTKKVSVSQVTWYVYNPVPASFTGLSAGRTNNTFTIETNSTDTEPTSLTTTNPSMITSLKAEHSDKDAVNGIYVWTVTFDVSENTDAFSRNAEISITIGGVSKTVPVSQQATVSIPTNVQDGMANCYMVTPRDNISFKVSRAYTYTGIAFTNTLHTGGEYTGEFGVEVVWQDVANLVTPTVSGSGNSATVHVQANGYTQGNAVVKIYKADDGSKTPVWSYHIWVTNYTGSATKTNNGFTFMDRNLGATKTGRPTSTGAGANFGFGLFYQWGRKDPFPATGAPDESQPGGGTFTAVDTSSSKGTITYTLQHPNTFLTGVSGSSDDWLYAFRDGELWGHSGTKTIYDPCPPGWRVPKNSGISEATSPWDGFTSSNGTWSYGYNWGTNAVYPAAGYRDNGSDIRLEGSDGYYWSASPPSSSSSYASGLVFASGVVDVGNHYVYRAAGFSVRCVRE